MNWSEARLRTIKEWERIRDHLDDIEPVELLTEINAMNSLCDKAEEDAHGHGRCGYCIGFHQFGGCESITAELSLAVADKDWPEVRKLVREYMERLEKLQV